MLQVQISSQDSDLLNVRLYQNPLGYVLLSNTREPIHRIILSRSLGRPLAKHEIVDHIDRNPRNNERSNLRLATYAQNSRNRGRHRRNTTGYKGVSVEKRSGNYSSHIMFEGTSIRIGTFNDPAHAAWMYDQWATELHGEFAVLNFEYV